MEEISIKYLNDDTEELCYVGGKSDWIDLRAAETVELEAGELKLINLGVAMKLPVGYEAIVAPRSSTLKNFDVLMANSIGVVDESYCGDDDWWRFPALAIRKTVIHKGDRICQFRIIKHQPKISFNKVGHLASENRGGFGSTGTR